MIIGKGGQLPSIFFELASVVPYKRGEITWVSEQQPAPLYVSSPGREEGSLAGGDGKLQSIFTELSEGR